MHYTRVGRHEDALRCATASLSIQPSVFAHRFRARALIALDRAGEAMTDARAGLDLATKAKQPTYEDQLILARILLAKGDATRAAKLAEAAHKAARDALGDEHEITKRAAEVLATATR